MHNEGYLSASQHFPVLAPRLRHQVAHMGHNCSECLDIVRELCLPYQLTFVSLHQSVILVSICVTFLYRIEYFSQLLLYVIQANICSDRRFVRRIRSNELLWLVMIAYLPALF